MLIVGSGSKTIIEDAGWDTYTLEGVFIRHSDEAVPYWWNPLRGEGSFTGRISQQASKRNRKIGKPEGYSKTEAGEKGKHNLL